MGTSIKYTDLSDEEPGPRARIDTIRLGGKLPLIGGKLTIRAKLLPASPLYRLVTAIALILSGCPCALVLFVIGMPRWVAAGALLLPAAVYLCFPGRRRLSEALMMFVTVGNRINTQRHKRSRRGQPR
jgi:hypothetical protein